jgi:sortase A
LAIAIVLWSVVAVVSVAVVLLYLEPMFEARSQSDLLASYQTTVLHAANEANTLAGATPPTKPVPYGAPVGILEIGTLHLREVVVEGVSARTTQRAPGHVPGTAGLGQPGNSAIVGRNQLFGASFGRLDRLHRRDRMLVTTTQGQSVYQVRSVSTRSVSQLDSIYRSSTRGRLTLVTAAGSDPLSIDKVTVVEADLLGKPYPPTPQHHRSASQTGRDGDRGALLVLGLGVAAFVVAAVFAVYLYRRMSPRVAYLLSTPVLMVAVVVLAESVSRLLPAWA